MRLGDLDALIGYFGDLAGDTIHITDVQAVLDNAPTVSCEGCERRDATTWCRLIATYREPHEACSDFWRSHDAEVHCPDCPEGGCTADYADGCGGKP